jgi:hypothetical protein
LVEKRTIAFVTLTMLVWASITTGFTAYYYLEQTKYQEQLHERQQLLDELTKNYDVSATRSNLLSADYGVLLGEYQWFSGDNYSVLMSEFEKLLSNLSGNYTMTLNAFPELNRTYNDLLNKSQTINEKSIKTREEFGSLLEDFYKLFSALAIKELGGFVGEVSVIQVSLCIDYGNQTIEWYNNTITSTGTTLFDLTRKIAKVEYSYWPAMEPGHILATSINNYTEGYWIWSYWDEGKNQWIFGPVGCDAWILRDNGIYKWVCSPY